MENNQIIVKSFQEFHFHFKNILNFKPILVIGTCTLKRGREKKSSTAVFPCKYSNKYGCKTYHTSFLYKRQEAGLALCSPPP
jgi:hypothetical protein